MADPPAMPAPLRRHSRSSAPVRPDPRRPAPQAARFGHQADRATGALSALLLVGGAVAVVSAASPEPVLHGAEHDRADRPPGTDRAVAPGTARTRRTVDAASRFGRQPGRLPRTRASDGSSGSGSGSSGSPASPGPGRDADDLGPAPPRRPVHGEPPARRRDVGRRRRPGRSCAGDGRRVLRTGRGRRPGSG